MIKQPKIKVKKVLPEGAFAPKRGRPPKVHTIAKVDSAVGGGILNTTQPMPNVEMIAHKKPAGVARGIQGFDAQLVMQTLSSVIGDNDDDFASHGGVLESSEQSDGYGRRSSEGTSRAMMMHGQQHDEDDNATVSVGMEVDHGDQERTDVGVDREGDETETEDEVEGTPVIATARTTARLEQKEAAKREREAKEKNREKEKASNPHECNMSDVPGRELLGSKMLAYMTIFPENDIVGMFSSILSYTLHLY